METVPTEVKQLNTFIRDEYVKNKHDSLLYATFIHNLKSDGLEKVIEGNLKLWYNKIRKNYNRI